LSLPSLPLHDLANLVLLLRRGFIDRLFYRMAGLTDAESASLEERLARML
jgi:hypothetical protein